MKEFIFFNFSFVHTVFHSTGTLHSNVGVCRSETIQVVLDCSQGSGVVIGPKCGQGYTITQIIPDSVADRCGCIQIGDRLIAINKLYNLDASTMRQILGDHLSASSYHPPGTYWVELEIEFDMSDSVIPSSGVFNVKLAKVSKSGLGITVNGTSHGAFVISEVKQGSPAHRTGSLRAGDILLAVDSQTLQHFNVDALLKDRSKDFTTLTIKRNSLPDFLFDAQQRCNTIYHNIGSTGALTSKMDYPLYGSSPNTNKFAEQKCSLEPGPIGLPPHGVKAQSCQPDYYNVDVHDSRHATPANATAAAGISAVQIRRPFLLKGSEPPGLGRLIGNENTQSLTTEVPDDYNDMQYEAEFHQQFPRYHKTILSIFYSRILINRLQFVNSSFDATIPAPMENNSYGTHQLVVNVRLEINGGPLGITLSGSEDAQKPILISAVSEGGIAYNSRKIHIGDCLLAINGESVQDKPLSHATKLLHNLGNIVDLKVSRSINGKRKFCKYCIKRIID